ncbi:unnamed protein product [Cladocopium goreaui]|uniref:C3H1-type domain-containing protein n=1 Tax=Cladocopium goreaui TaxID=2562237 RepID=A0A9P1D5H0_9DINO|nr:unnamed protein product [Cladocopium goreaui]
MASFQFDSGRSPVFGDVFAERQAPIGPSDNNSALLDRREWPSLEISLPELESDFPAYPPEAVEVRNTFIHVASPAAEDADRPVLSCPASKIGWIEDLLEDQKNRPPTPPAPPTHPPPVLKQKEEFSRPVIRLENALEVQAAAAQADAGLQVPQVPLSMGRSQGTGRALGVIGDQRGRGQSTYMLPTAYSSTGGDMNPLNPARSHTVGAIGPVAFVPSVPAGPAPAGPILGTGQTASSLGPHAPKPHGTKELPSVGSAGHAFGTCKPCGFFYAKGCLNGAACSFCHLCDRGEKKRRQKQKKACLKGGA